MADAPRFRIEMDEIDSYACEECEEDTACRVVSLFFPSRDRRVRVGNYCEPCADRIAECIAEDIDARKGKVKA